MQQVGSVLGNLKSMAADMGQEIDRQNQQLDKVGAKVQYRLLTLFRFFTHFKFSLQATNADTKIGSANQRTGKLLK